VDEKHVIWLLALLQYQNTNRNASGIKQISRQANHGIDMAIFQQLGAEALLCTAPEKHAMRQDDRHRAIAPSRPRA
jgi:hypothetical protein